MGKLSTIFGHKSKEKCRPKVVVEHKVIKRSTQSIINATINQTIAKKKIDVIITSVDYNDFLILSLENNTKYFENITVVTSNDDIICQNICKSYGVKCITTDSFYEDDFLFNKGKAINIGIESIVNPEFILLLDADIIVTNKIELSNLETDTLYTSDRWICYNHFQYERWRKGETQVNNLPKYERDNGYGFFQLFNFNNSLDVKWYPSDVENSSHPDLKFSSYFPKKQTIGVDIIHLGDVKKNWNGRKSENFISQEVIDLLLLKESNFNINSYFDSIFCLNIDRRVDRWNKVNSQFKKFDIEVTRWSAVDGSSISDEEFNPYITKDMSVSRISRLGLIENKNSLACLLSHLEIIKHAKINKLKRILIFEDDVILSNEFMDKIKNIYSIDWKLMYLGCSQFEWRKINLSGDFYNCKRTLGTFAYAVDESIYDEIIEKLETKKKSVDNLFSEIQERNWGKCFTIFPNIVISDVEDSDIRGKEIIVNYAEKVKWNLDSFNIEDDSKINNIEDFDKKNNILFLINQNNVGGAEYVSYKHIEMCKQLGYNPIVVSANKGMFYEKIEKLNVEVHYHDLNNMKRNDVISILYELIKKCNIVYNCNYFYMTNFIKTIKEKIIFKYYTIAHSDINWIVDSLANYDHITDKYIVIHDKIRNKLTKKGISNTRIFTIPNFIDHEELNSNFEKFDNSLIKLEYKIQKKDFIIGMLTRISPDKNILDAIKIVDMMKSDNIKLMIVGDNQNTDESIKYKIKVIDYIKELKLEDKVIITGNINNSDIYKFISCFDICINTSPSEGLPISLLECMSCGIHCVYPSHGEIPELLTGFGSVINLKQKEFLENKNSLDYLLSRYSDKELYKYVEEINTLIKIKIDPKKISTHIKINRSSEKFSSTLDFLYSGFKPGISFIIRARDEESNVENCIKNIIDIADEIIFVDHLSKDKTYEIALELSNKYDNVKVYKYQNEIPKPGTYYLDNIKKYGDSISNYYNFCLSKSTMSNIIKWDADFIPIRENLIEMINKFKLRSRQDKFSLWFTGKTMFINGNDKYINQDSFYDEFRSFSLQNGVVWEDALRCEYISPNYIKDSIKLRFEKPIFYEIKNINIDEFYLRDSLIDKRDIDDHNIISELRNNVIPKNLTKYEI